MSQYLDVTPALPGDFAYVERGDQTYDKVPVIAWEIKPSKALPILASNCLVYVRFVERSGIVMGFHHDDYYSRNDAQIVDGEDLVQLRELAL